MSKKNRTIQKAVNEDLIGINDPEPSISLNGDESETSKVESLKKEATNLQLDNFDENYVLKNGKLYAYEPVEESFDNNLTERRDIKDGSIEDNLKNNSKNLEEEAFEFFNEKKFKRNPILGNVFPGFYVFLGNSETGKSILFTALNEYYKKDHPKISTLLKMGEWETPNFINKSLHKLFIDYKKYAPDIVFIDSLQLALTNPEVIGESVKKVLGIDSLSSAAKSKAVSSGFSTLISHINSYGLANKQAFFCIVNPAIAVDSEAYNETVLLMKASTSGSIETKKSKIIKVDGCKTFIGVYLMTIRDVGEGLIHLSARFRKPTEIDFIISGFGIERFTFTQHVDQGYTLTEIDSGSANDTEFSESLTPDNSQTQKQSLAVNVTKNSDFIADALNSIIID
jgi:hypothetical protein